MKRGNPGSSGAGIAFGGALISAVLLWFAYPPVSIFPLALIAYAPLLNRTPDQSARARFFIGWIHGAVLHAALFYWLPDGLKEARGADTREAFQAFINFSLYQGLFSGFFLWLLGFLGWKKSPFVFALGAGSLFALLESLFPFLVPLPLGGIAYKFPVLVQAIELGSVSSLSFFFVFSSALLGRSVSPHGSGQKGELKPWAIIVVLLSFFICVYGIGRIHFATSTDSELAKEREGSLSLGVVQPNLPIELDRQNNIASRAAILDLTLGVQQALPEGSDLILWPEGAFPFFFLPQERKGLPEGRQSYSHRYTQRILDHVRSQGRPLIMGAMHEGGAGRIENGVFALSPDGSHQRYLKRWPLPWIEGGSFLRHIFGTTVEPLVLREVAQGDVFEVDRLKILPTLYQELGYGLDLYRRVASAKPDLILNLSDDRWFGSSSASELQVMNQVVRAVELRTPVARVAYGGVSVFVDEMGQILYRTALLVEAAERWDYQRDEEIIPFAARPGFFLLGYTVLLFLLMVWDRLGARKLGRRSSSRRKS